MAVESNSKSKPLLQIVCDLTQLGINGTNTGGQKFEIFYFMFLQ